MIRNRTFWLLLANILLAIFIAYNFREQPTPENLMDGLTSDILSQLVEIKISNPSHNQSISLRKKNSGWHIQHPIKWPAEKVGISNLLSQLNHLNPTLLFSVDQLAERGEIVSDYGFDHNSSTLILKSSDNFLKYTFGSKNRDETKRYLLISSSDSSIWQCPKPLHDLLGQSLTQWAEPTFLRVPIFAVDALQISEYQDDQISHETHVAKSGNNWKISLPFSTDANEEEVLFFLHHLGSGRLIGFAEPNIMDLNISKVFDVRIRSTNQNIDFSFYKVNDVKFPNLLVSSNFTEQKFWIHPDFIEPFHDIANRIREKRLFSLEAVNVDRIKITDGNNSITLRNQGQEYWTGLEDNISSSTSFEADFPTINEFLHKLNTVEVTTFTAFNPTPSQLIEQGLNRPELKLEIDFKDSTRENVLISRSNSESSLWNTYVINQAIICLVNTPWNHLLSTNRMEFKNRNLLPQDFRCDQIILKRKDPEEIILEHSLKSDIQTLKNIQSFRAKSFIDSSFNDDGVWIEGDWLPWKYSIQFLSTDQHDSSSFVFELSERQGADKCYAGCEKLGVICSLPISIIDDLFNLIRSQTPTP